MRLLALALLLCSWGLSLGNELTHSSRRHRTHLRSKGGNGKELGATQQRHRRETAEERTAEDKYAAFGKTHNPEPDNVKVFSKGQGKPFSFLIPRRVEDNGIIQPQLIQPQQLIELPCVHANGTNDLVERNEEIRLITWFYGKTLEGDTD